MVFRDPQNGNQTWQWKFQKFRKTKSSTSSGVPTWLARGEWVQPINSWHFGFLYPNISNRSPSYSHEKTYCCWLKHPFLIPSPNYSSHFFTMAHVLFLPLAIAGFLRRRSPTPSANRSAWLMRSWGLSRVSLAVVKWWSGGGTLLKGWPLGM